MTRVKPGRFVTFEGIEGVGKSTNIACFTRVLEARDIPFMTTREPGGTPLAERLRDMVAEHGEEPLPAIAELLIVFAARALHVENVIRPALAEGTWVISDRFTDSSRAYQGGGRGLPAATIETLAHWVHAGLQPDLTILLDAPVATALSRAGRRGEPDRFEAEQEAFFDRVRDAYLALAVAEPQRFVVVDAARDRDAIRADVDAIALSLLES